MLKVAFDRRLTFTIGNCAFSGEPDCVIWNTISHMTLHTSSGGINPFSYPDPSYLDRVTKELAMFGITEADIIDSDSSSSNNGFSGRFMNEIGTASSNNGTSASHTRSGASPTDQLLVANFPGAGATYIGAIAGHDHAGESQIGSDSIYTGDGANLEGNIATNAGIVPGPFHNRNSAGALLSSGNNSLNGKLLLLTQDLVLVFKYIIFILF